MDELTKKVMAWADREGLLDGSGGSVPAPAPAAPTPVAAAPTGDVPMSKEAYEALPAVRRHRNRQAKEKALAILNDEANNPDSWTDDEVELEYAWVDEEGDEVYDIATVSPKVINAVAMMLQAEPSEEELERIVELVGEDEVAAIAFTMNAALTAQETQDDQQFVADRVATLTDWRQKINDHMTNLASRDRYAGVLDAETGRDAFDQVLAQAVVAGGIDLEVATLDELTKLADDVMARKAFALHAEREAAEATLLQNALADEAGINMASESMDGEPVFRDVLSPDGHVVDRVPVRSPVTPNLTDAAYTAWMSSKTNDELMAWAAEVDAGAVRLEEEAEARMIEQGRIEAAAHRARDLKEFERSQGRRDAKPDAVVVESRTQTSEVAATEAAVVAAGAGAPKPSGEMTPAEADAWAAAQNAAIERDGL